MAKKLHHKSSEFKHLSIWFSTEIIRNPSNSMVDGTMRWIKKEAIANLHLLKIHFKWARSK
jgi:hypothetical protein